MPSDIREFVSTHFAGKAGLPASELSDLTLGEVVLKSPTMRNSVDLMEAFASTANVLRKERGIRVRLPAYPLDTPVSKVFDALLEQITQAEQKDAV